MQRVQRSNQPGPQALHESPQLLRLAHHRPRTSRQVQRHLQNPSSPRRPTRLQPRPSNVHQPGASMLLPHHPQLKRLFLRANPLPERVPRLRHQRLRHQTSPLFHDLRAPGVRQRQDPHSAPPLHNQRQRRLRFVPA